MKTTIVITPGMQFGRLTVLDLSPKRTGGHKCYNCRCECGVLKTVNSNSLRRGTTVSCGCYQRELHREVCRRNFTKHGHCAAHPKEHAAWRNMIDRCTRPNNLAFKFYGKRGISVCQRWLDSFDNFFDDMGPSPSLKHSIERVNNDGDYEPDNCAWVTWEVQHNNHRRCRHITHQGVTRTATQWAKQVGVKPGVILYRLKAGWSVEEILFTPVDSAHTGLRRNRS